MEINRLVYGLYGLTEEEIQIVEGVENYERGQLYIEEYKQLILTI
ncbi:MAG: hypothetical protein NTX93_02105 [Bacteroidia bacterium]|nr:hypothetical protein [Bacteroidia bacterium]